MEAVSSERRLYSLDLLRGLDMMFLTVVAPLLWACHAVWGLPQGVLKPVTVKFAEMLTPGFPHLLGTAKYQPLIVAIVVIAEIVVVLRIRRALKGKLKENLKERM